MKRLLKKHLRLKRLLRLKPLLKKCLLKKRHPRPKKRLKANRKPFVLSLSKHSLRNLCFDKLSTNGG